MRPENATVTADCFEVLLRELVPLKQVRGRGPTPASDFFSMPLALLVSVLLILQRCSPQASP